MQSKRELFFKNEASPAPALVTTINNVNSGPTSLGGGGSNSIQTKELNSLPGKIDTIRTHHTTGSGNIEDNRERESKESKMKMEKQEKDKRRKELDGYVGFANLPNQVYRKAVKKGFDFTLMVVGMCSSFDFVNLLHLQSCFITLICFCRRIRSRKVDVN